MCVLCQSDPTRRSSARVLDILTWFELDTPKKALVHLQRCKKLGVFCSEELESLIYNKKICPDCMQSYVNNLNIVTEYALLYEATPTRTIVSSVTETVGNPTDGYKTCTRVTYDDGTFEYR